MVDDCGLALIDGLLIVAELLLKAGGRLEFALVDGLLIAVELLVEAGGVTAMIPIAARSAAGWY